MENKKWTNRDWFWLVGILVGIMIFMVAGFFNSDRVEMNFSIISSAVSIALAIIAIAIALRQASDNQLVNMNASNLLNQIEAKLKNVDEKVSNLDLRAFAKAKEETVEDFKKQTEIKESYTASELNEIVENLSNDLTKKLMDITNYTDNFSHKTNLIYRVILENPHLTVNDIQKQLSNRYGIDVLESTIYAVLNNIRDEKK